MKLLTGFAARDKRRLGAGLAGIDSSRSRLCLLDIVKAVKLISTYSAILTQQYRPGMFNSDLNANS